MLIIGLTGGIAAGKTTIAEAFARRGAVWVDVDHLAREIVMPGEAALADIRARFGEPVMTEQGELNRAALRQIIFDDVQARHDLEAITHPRIRERLIQRLEALSGPYALLVSPLLLETDQHQLVNRILVIDVPPEEQIRRTCERDGVPESQARAIVDAQMSRNRRLASADDVIDNVGSFHVVDARIDRLDLFYRQLASQYNAP
ncbi:dephospho-CoA kinase [Kushneria marisflavi]|uniref:Dephospho-CoA kinase n=1 Tax=Kushneria marisflavi TaxID=157779 RepID=A0A240UTD6_9GAMM|nr:dephospho-CoA kinase [Kushneria marisflavi]ART64289.1 dephospho-CoA kinase [Kushneria marisflavi]RKD76752.1 dephospho-CoA kinase [Kushneria marisflavi]